MSATRPKKARPSRRRDKRIEWRRESLYGNYAPSIGYSNPDTACFVAQTTDARGPYRAIDKFYGEDKFFKNLASAKRWCEKRILARLPAGLR